jgi:uncharacterized protein (UPF0332 family)
MKNNPQQKEIIKLWLEKADDALDSAKLELDQNHVSFAVNRLYYACFYAVTSLLLQNQKQFTRHSAVKSEFIKTYIKSGKIDVKWNRFYQKLLDDRQEGDYIPNASFDKEEMSNRLQQAYEFIDIIRKLIYQN